MLEDALALQEAGCFALVFEAIPADVTDVIMEHMEVPIIGIGAGSSTDGQVLVLHDLLGIHDGFQPKFVKRYADVKAEMVRGVEAYVERGAHARLPARRAHLRHRAGGARAPAGAAASAAVRPCSNSTSRFTYTGRPCRLSQLFAPKEREFFDLFEEAGANIVRAAALLEQMLENWPDHAELARDMLVCEQEGDRITHDIIQRLNSTFVTPIDREDIFALASALDDIVDFIEEVADFLGLYRIEAPMDQAIELAQVLHQSRRRSPAAIPRLRTFKDIHHYIVEIHRLENDGDRLEREALASLFERGIDPMIVIRWKDIFERLEDAVDATETTANTLEGIVIKNQ